MAARSETLAASRLGRVARRSAEKAPPVEEERCELCNEPIPPQHRHLLDVESRELMCACRACKILFDRPAAGAGGRHYRLVPERRLEIEDFELDDVTWAELRIPVEMAFFFYSTAAERVVVFYPSPMGATESLLELESWQELERANPVLGCMEADVEALLVNRARGARAHFIVPIDDCYGLVGLIRTTWKGLSGGQEVWGKIEAFFTALAGRSKKTTRANNTEEATWQTSGPARAI